MPEGKVEIARCTQHIPLPTANAAILIQGTLDSPPTLVQHVRVNHRRAHITVTEQLLDRANVIP